MIVLYTEGKFNPDEILRDMVQALSCVKRKWYLIGVQLQVSTTCLDEIEQQHGKDLDRALIEMMKKWLQLKMSQTSKHDVWVEVVSTLKSEPIRERVYAGEVERKYINQDRPPKGMNT